MDGHLLLIKQRPLKRSVYKANLLNPDIFPGCDGLYALFLL